MASRCSTAENLRLENLIKAVFRAFSRGKRLSLPLDFVYCRLQAHFQMITAHRSPHLMAAALPRAFMQINK